MDLVDIRVFQAAATVIPTFFLAYALHASNFNRSVADEEPEVYMRVKKGEIVAFASLLFFFLAGEALCLVVLALNRPALWACLGVIFVCLVLGWYAALEFIRPDLLRSFQNNDIRAKFSASLTFFPCIGLVIVCAMWFALLTN